MALAIHWTLHYRYSSHMMAHTVAHTTCTLIRFNTYTVYRDLIGTCIQGPLRDLLDYTDTRRLPIYILTRLHRRKTIAHIHISKQLVVLIYLMNVSWHLFLSSAADHPSLTILLTCLVSPLSQKNYTGVLGTLTKKGNYEVIAMIEVLFLDCNY